MEPANQLLHRHGVRPHPAQIGRRFKGAHPGFHNKVLGIQHNAAHQGFRIAGGELAAREVLYQLGDHFTGGRA